MNTERLKLLELEFTYWNTQVLMLSTEYALKGGTSLKSKLMTANLKAWAAIEAYRELVPKG